LRAPPAAQPEPTPPNGLGGQTNPSKTKQNSLVLFGFIRPNRDFSMGYSESK
jgi:hypothetical protein